MTKDIKLGSYIDEFIDFKDNTIKEQVSKIVDLEWENMKLKNDKKNLEEDMKLISKICGGWIGLCYKWMREDKNDNYYTDEEINAKQAKYMERAQALREVRELIARTRDNRDF